ncbi:MAG TPA: 3D-(3,5/4)-trihydroxycyclohexane-1,2-dione acylhydrolase (decyclizing) [Candidatus Dormibacteraeota bacterium]|nr:3D-(3,5/4)-trihydroxycyclohexane-1,2-dione acylhydrolase (decyclizing) [Candidatus Dormibacteraeota bacterium]
MTVRLTMAQALVRFLAAQYAERDGVEHRFISGCFGIFGHGNVAGIGEALFERPDLLTYYQARNEQAMVHAAVGYARMNNRLRVLACTSSIGPGATNMVTGAALATVNRLPVLLLPGDVFASRPVDPVLQQLEVPWRGDASVNDCFQPVSRYWDRIVRPEQLMPAALEAMRVLTNPAETGAVTLALPQDVQAEAFDYPEAFFEKRTWSVPRAEPDSSALDRAAALIRAADRPIIVAGGGVIYSEATEALRTLVEATGIPVGETQAGKGSLPYDHPSSLGAIGASGTLAANRLARDADVVIGIGTRWSDFTTASHTAFGNAHAHFINLNVLDFDAHKNSGHALVGDARAGIDGLRGRLRGYAVNASYRDLAARLNKEWDREVERLYHLNHQPIPAQSEVIGAVNDAAGPRDVVVCAAGSMPGDLHKLWRAHDPKQYHVEYGYSCMGYEIAGALGVKMAAPDREVFSMVGDGSYLMMSSEIVTAVQEGIKLIVVLVDNHGFKSIGGLSRSLGTDGFGTQYRFRKNGSLGLDSERAPAPVLPIDLTANAASLGAEAVRVANVDALREALQNAKRATRTSVICIEADRYESVPDNESWWDVPVAEVSTVEAVDAARRDYEKSKKKQRRYL